LQKIIHILPNTIPEAYLQKKAIDSDPSIELNTGESPHRVVFGIDDWHVILSNIMKSKKPEIEMECWSFQEKIDKVYSKNIKEIIHKKFPASRLNFGNLFFGHKSVSMIKELNKMIKSEKIIVHLHGLHTHSVNAILLESNLSKVPLVITQRGGGSPEMYWKEKMTHIPQLVIEKLVESKIDKYILQSNYEYDYYIKSRNSKKYLFLQDGLDFNVFPKLSRKESRLKLGLDQDKKYILYVGRYYRGKGVDILIKNINSMKLQDKNIELILVGGYDTDELYPLVKEGGFLNITRIPKKELKWYYSAANITVMISNEEYLTKFAGIGNSQIESLACGTPIYSSQICHFMGNEKEKAKLGIQYTPNSNISADLSYILSNDYLETREISKKYYNIRNNVDKQLLIYSELFSEYYE